MFLSPPSIKALNEHLASPSPTPSVHFLASNLLNFVALLSKSCFTRTGYLTWKLVHLRTDRLSLFDRVDEEWRINCNSAKPNLTAISSSSSTSCSSAHTQKKKKPLKPSSLDSSINNNPLLIDQRAFRSRRSQLTWLPTALLGSLSLSLSICATIWSYAFGWLSIYFTL